MEHKLRLLFLGNNVPESIQSLSSIQLTHCAKGQDGLETFIANEFQIIISYYQLSDQTATTLYDKIQSYLQLYPNSSKKDTKFIVITDNEEQEKECKQRKLLYYPSHMDLRKLLLNLPITSSQQTKDEAGLLPINFTELFKRVDNNRVFIKSVIEKFIAVFPERVAELHQLIDEKNYQGTKDAAHKLKGVLANFSMEKARHTIIKIEKSALAHEQEETIKLIRRMEDQIKEAIQYYQDHQELFQE